MSYSRTRGNNTTRPFGISSSDRPEYFSFGKYQDDGVTRITKDGRFKLIRKGIKSGLKSGLSWYLLIDQTTDIEYECENMEDVQNKTWEVVSGERRQRVIGIKR